MCPGSPRSTLVPYTTLFRSAALGGGRVRAGGLPAAEPRPLGGHGRPGLRGRAARADPAARRAGAAGATPPGPDRVLRGRSEEHASELQSRGPLVWRLMPDKLKTVHYHLV